MNAARTANPSVGTTAVKASPGQLVAANLAAGAGAAATLTIYDDPAAASGTVLAVLAAAAGATDHWTPATPQLAAAGITAVLAGAGATAQIAYH